jgi:hypothetical protein
MPYKIAKSGSKYRVQKKDASHTFGTHPSRKAAQKQITALHINVKESFADKVNKYLLNFNGTKNNS